MLARGAVGREELIGVRDPIDVLPTAAGMRLEVRGKPDVREDFLPLQRKHQVRHGVGRGIRGMLVRGQQDRLRDRDPDALRDHVVEELVVRRPPERIVDHDRPVEGGLLQERAIERNVLADPVQDQVVLFRRFETDAADPDGLRHDVRIAPAVDPIHQGIGEGTLLTEENADRLHEKALFLTLKCRKRRRNPELCQASRGPATAGGNVATTVMQNGFERPLSRDLHPAAFGGPDPPRRVEKGRALAADALPRLDSPARLADSFAGRTGEDEDRRTRDGQGRRSRSARRLRPGWRRVGLRVEATASFSDRDPVSRTLLDSVLRAGVSRWRDSGLESDAGNADTESVVLRSGATKSRRAG